MSKPQLERSKSELKYLKLEIGQVLEYDYALLTKCTLSHIASGIHYWGGGKKSI